MRFERFRRRGERLSPRFRAEKIIARQACFRPVTQDGLPLIGSVPQIEGVYVGHPQCTGDRRSPSGENLTLGTRREWQERRPPPIADIRHRR
jgi:hypothetical protein